VCTAYPLSRLTAEVRCPPAAVSEPLPVPHSPPSDPGTPARRSGDTAYGWAADTEGMKDAPRRKAILAIVLASLAFSSAYASAGTLGSSKPFAAGNAPTASCTPSLSVSYSVAYAASLGGYRVSAVQVGPLGACTGRTVEISLTGTGGALLRQLTYTVKSPDAAAGRATISVDGSVSVGSVSGVSVALAG
jgi:hypothetical protein